MKYYFTFTQKQSLLKDKYIVVEGTFGEAREQMFENFGAKWAFQYNEQEWIMDDGRTQAEAFNLTELK